MSQPTEKPSSKQPRRLFERATSSPVFRALNFELFTRPSWNIALPGTLLFCGISVYLYFEHKRVKAQRAEEREREAKRMAQKGARARRRRELELAKSGQQ